MAELQLDTPAIGKDTPVETLVSIIREQATVISTYETQLSEFRDRIAALDRENKELRARLNQNSSNSNRPPSSDGPYKRPKRAKSPKTSQKKRRKRSGHRQKLLKPTEVHKVTPEACSCGCNEIADPKPFYTHQHIEIPEIPLNVHHFVLYQGRCQGCGKLLKAAAPKEFATGYGPRLSALIAELAGVYGNSRENIQSFLESFLNLHISKGAIQKVIDRASQAIEPYYDTIANAARESRVNHIDETPWFKKGKLNWLWVMANKTVAFFMVHTNRSQEAFDALVKAWQGILVADNYTLYQKWSTRQTCIAHLIRRAKGLAERDDDELRRCGTWALKELRRLCEWWKDPPTAAELQIFYARFSRLIAIYRNSKSEAVSVR